LKLKKLRHTHHEFQSHPEESAAIVNDPINRYGVDVPDIQRLLKLHRSSMDMKLVREYFRLFEKEDLLDEWIEGLD
jgi:hypothetical protein